MHERFLNWLFVSGARARQSFFDPLDVTRRHLVDLGCRDMGYVTVDEDSGDAVEIAIRGALAASDTLPDIVLTTMDCSDLKDRLPAPLAMMSVEPRPETDITVQLDGESWAAPRIDAPSVRALTGMFTVKEPVLILPRDDPPSQEARELSLLLGANRTVQDGVTPNEADWNKLRYSECVLIDEAVLDAMRWREACQRAGKNVIMLRSDAPELRSELIAELLEGDGMGDDGIANPCATFSPTFAPRDYANEALISMPTPELKDHQVLSTPQLNVEMRLDLEDLRGYVREASLGVYLNLGGGGAAVSDIGELSVESQGLLHGRVQKGAVVLNGWTGSGFVLLSLVIPGHLVFGANSSDIRLSWDRRMLDTVRATPSFAWSLGAPSAEGDVLRSPQSGMD